MLAFHTEVKTPASVFWSTEMSRQFVYECSASMFSTIFSSQFLKAPNALSTNTAKMFLIISHALTITGLNFPVPFWNLMPNTKKQISYKLLNVFPIINQHWLWLHLVQHQDVLSLFPLRCQFLVSISYWKATHYSWITKYKKPPLFIKTSLHAPEVTRTQRTFPTETKWLFEHKFNETWDTIHGISGTKASPS